MWKKIESIKDVESLNELSFRKPILIFKHSTRCGVSRFVLRNFENEYNIPVENLHLYFLDLLNYREVSNYIATYYQVQHQSPQTLLIKDGNVVLTQSHNQIEVEKIKDIL